MTYSDKLRDPRWQKRRLEILNAANWACEDCGATTKTLEVHHCIYFRDMEPWEYGDEFLMCLDGDCHERRQQLEESARAIQAVEMRHMSIYDLENLVWEPIHKSGRIDHLTSRGEL